MSEDHCEQCDEMSAQVPVRVQRTRKKGSKLTSPNGLPIVYVGRPTEWGNPWPVGESISLAKSIRWHKEFVKRTLELHPSYLAPLRGKNLACWCPLDQPCHADVLLELANQ